MADNLTIPVATKDIGGFHHQRVLPTSAATASVTSVDDNNASVSLLAANSNRISATIFNDSSALLYVLLGTGTASSTNYTAKVYSNGYYEIPSTWQGAVQGIWATDPNDGAARITEMTP